MEKIISKIFSPKTVPFIR